MQEPSYVGKFFFALCGLQLLLACSSGVDTKSVLPRCPQGSSLGLVDQTSGTGGASGATALPTLIEQFNLIQNSIVSLYCASCHSSIKNPIAGNIDLTVQATFSQNIDKILTAIKTTSLTDPKFMPRGGAALTSDMIADVELYKRILASSPSTGGSGTSGSDNESASGGNSSGAAQNSGATVTGNSAASGSVSPAGVTQNCVP